MNISGIALIVFGAVAVGMIGQGWASYLEHQRRSQALDAIKTALQAGREPPAELYALLRKDNGSRGPWDNIIVFGALSVGFWLAFALVEGERRVAFLVVAVTMTVTTLGCLALALAQPRRSRDDERR